MNALGIVERELVLGRSIDAPVVARVRELLGMSGASLDGPALVAALAARVRDGSLEGPEVSAVVRDLVRAKLDVANPRYR
jgi:hypothetical protein